MLLNTSLYPLCTDHAENTASIVKEACLLIPCLAVNVLLRALAPAGLCLPSRFLAMGVYVTILWNSFYLYVPVLNESLSKTEKIQISLRSRYRQVCEILDSDAVTQCSLVNSSTFRMNLKCRLSVSPKLR
jgi:hypothetical protein